MAASNGRLMKELTEVTKEDSSGVQARPVTEGDLRHLLGTVRGPEGTVYDGGVFEIEIHIPKQYPFEPPKMRYITKIWHPNVSSQTGAICLVSQSVSRQWDSLFKAVSPERAYCSCLWIQSHVSPRLSGYSERSVESSPND